MISRRRENIRVGERIVWRLQGNGNAGPPSRYTEPGCYFRYIASIHAVEAPNRKPERCTTEQTAHAPRCDPLLTPMSLAAPLLGPAAKYIGALGGPATLEIK
jgi:hypothetical protein